MRLLFDQNLSHQLVRRLADLFPGSAHLRDAGLGASRDINVWEHAQTTGFVIVSKDDDFHHLSFVRGAPPKVIGIRLGNCTTDAIEQLIRQRHAEIRAFELDPSAAYLPLS
ncbi:MAG: DUF5615 family PIN-like protein [Opitutaceae bacterium]